ncbi:MAG: PQQ-binding-like beta-propeller repeat protein [Planctomycetota bacterium]
MKKLVIATLLLFLPTMCQADDWTQFRGTGGKSVSQAKPPVVFDANTNIAFKTPMPGKGASGPIVIGDRVIVTCSSGENQDQLQTVCVDAKTGKELWKQEFWATGRCFCHPLSANAAPTPASDGERVYAFYSSNDLACMDLDGNLIWYRGLAVDYPKAGNDVGMSSSPAVKDGIVVVQVECQGDSFAMGLDAETGVTIWTKERNKVAVWSSPLIIEAGERSLVVLQSTTGVDVVDLKTGETAFQSEGETSSISSPAISDGKLFVPIEGTTAFAVSPDGSLSQEWNSPQLRPSSMSSVVYKNKLYALNRGGVLAVYNTADGTQVQKVRAIKGSNWSTPVVANGHMYFFAQAGGCFVIKLDEEGLVVTGDSNGAAEIINECNFEDEVFLGSPAIAGDALYVRSDRYLYKIGK